MPFDSTALLGITVYGGVILAALWIAMVIWAYRDMRSRSRDALAQLFVALVVAVLNLPGLFIYVLLRPRETLSDAYERSLEEEALLQEIEEKPTCPGCGQRVQDQWQACPHCHTRLKKLCLNCGELMELNWNLCPVCVSDQTRYQPQDKTVQSSRHVQRTTVEAPPAIPDKWLSGNARPTKGNAESPQYVEDEY
jgi:RNA polymerase subunit RPABC4/transcription elongation factor Spt4